MLVHQSSSIYFSQRAVGQAQSLYSMSRYLYVVQSNIDAIIHIDSHTFRSFSYNAVSYFVKLGTLNICDGAFVCSHRDQSGSVPQLVERSIILCKNLRGVNYGTKFAAKKLEHKT